MHSVKAFLFCYHNTKRYLSCRLCHILKFIQVQPCPPAFFCLIIINMYKKPVQHIQLHEGCLLNRSSKGTCTLYNVQFCLRYNSTRKHEQLEKMEPNQRGYLHTLISLHTGAFIIEGYKHYENVAM